MVTSHTGILASQPRHIGALVVLAELQERLGRWWEGVGGGGGDDQHDYAALLFYKRAYRCGCMVCV